MIILKKRKIKSLTAKAKLLQQNRQQTQAKTELVAKELKIYKTLASIYTGLIGDVNFPFAKEMVNESLRAAASLEDATATYQLAENLLEAAKFRMNLEKEGVFSSSLNLKYSEQLFEEAHAYLQASQKLGSFQGKRLLGICFIRGWGVPEDRPKGFDLVVSSIEQENSWDRVPEIFASIAKDDPALFSALMKYRTKA